MKVDITIVSAPTWIKFECPHCEAEVEIDYDEFSGSMVSNYPGDWESIECSYCEKEIEIDDIEWD